MPKIVSEDEEED
jgi:hypothetical protein